MQIEVDKFEILEKLDTEDLIGEIEDRNHGYYPETVVNKILSECDDGRLIDECESRGLEIKDDYEPTKLSDADYNLLLTLIDSLDKNDPRFDRSYYDLKEKLDEFHS